MKLTVQQIKYHRNGIGGAPFHAVRFADAEEGDRLGVVFEATSHVAVLTLDRLDVRDVGFGCNSWRGDRYEPHVRQAIKELEAERFPS